MNTMVCLDEAKSPELLQLNDQNPVNALLSLLQKLRKGELHQDEKQKFRDTISTGFARGVGSGSQFSNPDLWVKMFSEANQPRPKIFGVQAEIALDCPIHGSQKFQHNFSIIEIQLGQPLDRWLQEAYPCPQQHSSMITDELEMGSCSQRPPAKKSAIRYPQVVVVRFFGRETAPLETLNLQGTMFKLKAASRFVNGNHYISYTNSQGKWYKYDGRATPKIREIKISTELEMEGERNLFFFAKVWN